MLPWAEMLRAAAALGLEPRAFWRLSAREWRWLAGGAAAMDRRTLRDLMAVHPDTED